MEELISVKNLYFRYSGSKVNTLHDLSFSLKKGEVVAIKGLSGCGKSTLCYIIAGIIPKNISGIVSGEIKIKGRDIKDLSVLDQTKLIGIVFQEPDNQLFSPTIEAEIAFGPENLCVPKEEIEEIITSSLSLVGMSKYRYDNPNNLSGGQKQLIALTSVLSLDPEILIFDEAMSQIDSEGKKLIKETILKLKKEGRSIIMIEHDIDNLDVCDRVLTLENGRLKEE